MDGFIVGSSEELPSHRLVHKAAVLISLHRLRDAGQGKTGGDLMFHEATSCPFLFRKGFEQVDFCDISRP
jgi:hypothetical protein